MWSLPILLIVVTTVLAFPLSRYMAWIMNGKYRAPKILRWFEARLDSGEQNWKQYTASLLIFNTALFVLGFAVLALQAKLPGNPDGKGMLSPSTIFHSTISFMTNTDLQHYAGETHLSNFSQIFFGISNLFLSASIGLCALTAIIRALGGATALGNFFLDMWRVLIYMFLPCAFILGVIWLQQGSPMTFRAESQITTLQPDAMGQDSTGANNVQKIVVGPLAAFEPMKMLGTNGGGFYCMNSAHPFETPTALTNFLSTMAMMLFPFSLVLMYGRMLKRFRHSLVIFAVMLLMFIGTIVWTIYYDTLKPNPGLTAHSAPTQPYQVSDPNVPGGKRDVPFPAVAGLPVDQHLGNLEGKELRFGTSAGATFAAITVDVTCGAVNCEHDSLNPIAALSPMTGMWLNCIFGGKGVGMINMLLFIIVGIFIAGQMVGRTPEYLGKKLGRREMTLAMLALLVHPIMILMPTGVFAATNWGMKATSNPGPHGFSQMLYQFSSASANNGSAMDGLGTTYGFNNNKVAAESVPWDIATGLVMLFSRFLPIVAPIAMAASLAAKKSTPFGLGTLRDDTPTFGFLLLGTILIIGALLFLPVAALGPIAEHLGPIPFGG